MAEELKEQSVQEENKVAEETNEEEQQEQSQEQEEEMIPRSQFEKELKARLAREKKAREKAVEEAEKLAKMNAEQKKEYEYEKMQEELEEYKKRDQYYKLSKEASKMLAEHDITADEEVLSLVVKDDAEETQASVNAFVNLFNAKVEEGVKKALSGNSPKVNATQGKALTKEDIMGIKDAEQRIKAIQENPNLFK